MHFKKVCFAVILVLLAQIIVMKKLDRTKNKKQPSSSYRAYARKHTKRSSVVPTQEPHPKFNAGAIPPESMHKKKSNPDVSSKPRNKSTKKKGKSTKPASNKKRKRAIEVVTLSTLESTEISNSITQSESPSTDPSNAEVSNSSELTPITTDSSTILMNSASSIFSISSEYSVSSSFSSFSESSASSSEILEETVTVEVGAGDKNELADTCYGKGKVSFTQYWIPIENQWDEDNDGERMYLGENEKIDIMDKNGNSLAVIPMSMHKKCKMEGTCLLENGDIINIDNTTNSFMRVGGQGRETNVFGLGSGNQNLVPFISIAANDLPYGQKLYIKQLDGVDLGKGRIHNGCVRVDDDSWSFDACQIDFFVLTYLDYLWLNLNMDHVNVKLADCELKNYILKDDMSGIKATNKTEIIPSLLEAKFVEYTE